MGTKYIYLICLLSLMINGLSVYNFIYGILSIFLMLGVFTLHIVKKALNKVKKISETQDSFLSEAASEYVRYATRPSTKKVNRWSIYIAVAVLIFVTILITILQIIFRGKFSEFITMIFPSGNYDLAAVCLSWLGYGLFFIALMAVLLDFARMLKTEEMFRS
ncbi:hypothetical protein ACFO4N_16630 [Camelliibacillus cellulosilyticus]|uniref:DUF2975 family protein n=1 Tax=Camelliibacillus cellulosilyticus TaxID=2174486 RepID=A0ABV9GUM2_9BACL